MVSPLPGQPTCHPAADIQGDLCFVSLVADQDSCRNLRLDISRILLRGQLTPAPAPLLYLLPHLSLSSLSSTDLVSIVTSFNYLCPIPGLAQGPGAGGGVTLCFPG